MLTSRLLKELFSEEMRRDPYPYYAEMRNSSPVHYVPPPFDAWLIFDYQGAKWALNDHQTFSSEVRPSPPHWFVFVDPPRHTKVRALISQAFTPRSIANLEPRIREISRQLLRPARERGEMDVAVEYSIPLPMMVLAEMLGMPSADWPQFHRWTDSILKLSQTRSDGEQLAAALNDYQSVTVEMSGYLAEMMEERRASPKDDLLTRLTAAELDGERLKPEEILGLFQLLLSAGQETTTNLINNAMLCLMENPEQRERLLERMDLLPRMLEEALRFRSPVAWMMRTPRRDVDVRGKTIEAGKLVLPMIGSANRDAAQFPDAARFDMERDPNPHVAFGHGIHFCVGAALARLEARVALGDLLALKNFERTSGEPWEPKQAYNVHGPARLPVRFEVTEKWEVAG